MEVTMERTVEHAHWRVKVIRVDARRCAASAANKSGVMIHVAVEGDEVAALRELYRQVSNLLGAVTEAGKLAGKLKGERR